MLDYLNRLSIKGRIALGFSVVVAFLGLMILLSQSALRSEKEAHQEFQRRTQQMMVLLNVKATFNDINRPRVWLMLAEGQMQAFDVSLDALKERVAYSRDLFRRAERKGLMAAVLKHIEAYQMMIRKIATMGEGEKDFAATVDALRGEGDQIRERIAAVIEILSKDFDSAESTMETRMAIYSVCLNILGAMIFVFCLASSFFIWRSIAVPLRAMTEAMTGLAEGDLMVDVPSVGAGDEMGRMARAVLVFKQHAQKVAAMAEDQKRAEAEALKERRAALMEQENSYIWPDEPKEQ